MNVEGGAVAHGHPIGATGAVLTTRLLYSMQGSAARLRPYGASTLVTGTSLSLTNRAHSATRNHRRSYLLRRFGEHCREYRNVGFALG